ncbi:membrane protein [Methylophilales bacterium MBRSG12]|uniref:Membrane protein n=1 Tax=Methylophilales bacterium MBRS-H7 TaxID=1623450 RepID=A0A0H4J1R7_9PROT|nr:membrane protein [Methylophilales bacterium MBRSF5]AKO65990.1 membrane protein [Methylophilales bacterium MBRS-H7]AKO67800.1 membrane protein [Methylophilales bacterium MBRSG12]
MENITTINIIGTALFAIAILHTFSTKYFEHLAHTHKKFSGILHLLGEVEIVFGFWAMVLVVFMFVLEGSSSAVGYVDSRNFTEPMFVFVIMVIAATKPILESSEKIVVLMSKLIPIKTEVGMFFLLLSFVPLLGSFITEPAAMTLAALLLGRLYYSNKLSDKFKYLTLGVLFVNISIGGTLTPYAAPPVLMVAGTWNWDILFMMENFGWRSAIAVLINASALTFFYKKELSQINFKAQTKKGVPFALTVTHLLFLLGVVIFAHHPAVFMALFLFFLGITTAYKHYQSELILKEALLVAFFLAGLVVIGGVQQWWLQPVLVSMSDNAVYFGATILTAFTDNAALTYLGSLVDGLSEPFKISLVAGAVTGGGLTVIANAPNPAGISILKKYFNEKAVSPLGLLLGALIPTLVTIILFRVI